MAQRMRYARLHLPRLGSGSSRTVYGLGSGKVLKIASGSSGPEQSENEVDAYTSGRAKKFLAQIYDFDSKNYMWLISEGVKVFADNDDLMAKIHPSELLLNKLANKATMNSSFEDALKSGIEAHNHSYKETFAVFNVQTELHLDDFNDLDLELFHKVYEATKLGIIDIDRYDHWGMTANGRLVIVDYGIFRKGFKNG